MSASQSITNGAGKIVPLFDAVCGGCHGSPHAIYPATDRDNVLPLQYMKEAQPMGANGNCTVCHIEAMDTPMHHDNMGLEN